METYEKVGGYIIDFDAGIGMWFGRLEDEDTGATVDTTDAFSYKSDLIAFIKEEA